MNAPPELPQDPLFAPASSRPVGRRHNIRVGTCSWTDPSLIKAKTFYPRGCSTAEKRLAFYASQFPVVEVDSSFFAMPQPQHAALWAERTPAGFQFNVKAFRLLTGHQTPPEVFPPDMKPWLPPLAARKKNYYYADLPPELQDELWRRFIAALAPLKAAGKLKAVHFQFAPWATSAPEWRAHVELCVERMAGHLLAVEFRNQSWLNEAQAEIEAWLPERLGLQLNPTKTILQPIARGVDFAGQVIKPWHRVTRRRTLNEALSRTRQTKPQDLFETANSYFGLLRQATHSHHDRARLANVLRRRGMTINGALTKTYRRRK